MRVLIHFVLAAALAANAAAQDARRLDPAIGAVLRAQARAAPAAPPALAAASEERIGEFPLGLALRPAGPGDPARLGVFVRLASPAALDELRAAGAEIGTVIGDIATARVPIDALPLLARSPAIASIDAARAVAVRHDSSMAAIGVDELRRVVGDTWSGATGQGSVVAIYDTGLDLDHPDFIAPDGQTRVLGVWDQTAESDNPPTGFSRGFYCTRAAVQQRIEGDASACPQRDNQGHGTHVTGSAAGDGSATGNGGTAFRYAGVAPNADLLIVKGGPGIFFEDLIIDGLAWLKQEGQRLGRPVVANLSLGGQFGPHDGSRIYEEAIDELSGPGFIVVISAGNAGSNENTQPDANRQLIHARGFADGTATTEFEIVIPDYVPSGNTCNSNFVNIDFWYDGADRLNIEVVRPDGTSAAAATGAVTSDEEDGGHIEIDNGSGGVDPGNGDYEALINIDGCGTAGSTPEPGTWRIRVTPTQPGSGAPFDLWMYRWQLGLNFSRAPVGGAGFDNQFIVGSPGNATRAVTVAAFVTRLCWPAQTGEQACYVDREAIGDIARFSSAGPRRDGVLKPEIAAPGLGIASARSTEASAPANRVLDDGVHWILEGTSMSAPHVTGAIAVLFGSQPTLTPEQVKEVFQATATQDAFTGRVYGALGPEPSPMHWWGFGKLDVRDALQHISGDEPAVLALESTPAIPDTTTLGAEGTRLPVLRLSLASQGFEPIRVTELVFEVEGDDPGARLILARDANGNGQIDAAEPIIASAPAPTNDGVARVEIEPESFVIPEFSEVEVLVALELSGQAPNGTGFEVTFVADATRSIGTETNVQNELAISTEPLESGVAQTTLLQPDQRVSLSENPVRGTDVTFNFVEAPTTAALYTVNGRRVADLRRRIGSGELNLTWDLTNDEGSPVAPGVYLLVFSVAGEVFREKLIVLTPASRPEQQE